MLHIEGILALLVTTIYEDYPSKDVSYVYKFKTEFISYSKTKQKTVMLWKIHIRKYILNYFTFPYIFFSLL